MSQGKAILHTEDMMRMSGGKASEFICAPHERLKAPAWKKMKQATTVRRVGSQQFQDTFEPQMPCRMNSS
jgi:hypothetical protein